MADEYDDDDYSGGRSPLALVGMQEQYTTPEALAYARKILGRTVDNPSSAGTDAYLNKVKSNADSARMALRNARKHLAAAKYGNSEQWLAASAALGAPTRTGHFGEALGRVPGALIEPRRRQREWNEGRDKGVLDLDLALSNVDDEYLAAQLQLMKMRQEQDTKLSVEAMKTLGRRVGQPSPQQKKRDAATQAVDREYSKDYVEFIQTGASDAAKGLQDLHTAVERLDPADPKAPRPDNLTGPLVGIISRIPWIGKTVQDVTMPESADTQEMVEYTVQRSLRPILGSQFTKDEGERLISRVYNPALDERTNANRLRHLIEQMTRAYEAKVGAADYFREHGTLEGFDGQIRFNVDDIWTRDDDKYGTGLKGDPLLAKSAAPKQDPQQYKPDPSKPPLYYEDLVPAGEEEEGFAEGGMVGADEEIDSSGRTPFTMPDGQVVYAKPGVPYEKVLSRYSMAMEKAGSPLQAPQEAPQEIPQEPSPQEEPAINMPAADVVDVAGSDPGMLAALGYGAAGAGGGRYGAKLSHFLADRVPGHKSTKAESRVLRALENEGLNPTEWAKLVTQAQRMGVPVNGLDMGGIEMRALGEQAMNPENPETRQLYRETVERQRGSRDRVVDQVNKGLKPDDYFDTEKKLLEQMREGSGDAYRELYKQFPNLRSEQLMQLMNTPSGAKAVKSATKSIRDKPGSTIGKADATGMVTRPSLEFLDQVKQDLDDLINAEETQGGAYKPTGKGRRMRSIRNALRDEMDALTTDKSGVSAYKTARDTHSGGLELRDALRFGREDFMKLDPKEISEHIKDMNFSEKDALRTGVAQNLFEQIGKTGSRQNSAAKIVDTPDNVKRLQLLFDKPKEFEIFKAALDLEQRIYEDSKSTISRGRTKLMSTRDAQDNVMRRTAKRVPFNIWSPTSWAVSWLRRQEPIKPKEAAEILRILKTSDPKEIKKIEANLTSKFGRVAARKKRAGKAAILGGVAGAAFPFIKDYMKDDEEPVKKARGGLVRTPGWRRIAESVIDSTLFGSDDALSSLQARLG
jgi:hypothetical protein